MRIVVSYKQFRLIKAALLMRLFGVSRADAARASRRMRRRECEKIKIETMWYKRK